MRLKADRFEINKVRVASPCSVGWESMSGNDRVRTCDSCRLNIYNTAEMTAAEVASLIQNHEGRLCVRLRRRADGTLITKDCPVGVRHYHRRLMTSAGAVLSLVFGLFSTGFGQKTKVPDPKAPRAASLADHDQQNEKGELSGTVTDPQGAIVPGAKLSLYRNRKMKPVRTESDANGGFVFRLLAPGTYTLKVDGLEGFNASIYKNIRIAWQYVSKLAVILQPRASEVVGIYAEEPLIDTTSSSVTTIIKIPR